MHWIVTYPVNSVLKLSNNPGQTDWVLCNAKCATGFSYTVFLLIHGQSNTCADR